MDNEKIELHHFENRTFTISLVVVDGVLCVHHEGQLSYWDEIGVAEAYRAILRMKVLGDYRWPHQDEARAQRAKQSAPQGSIDSVHTDHPH